MRKIGVAVGGGVAFSIPVVLVLAVIAVSIILFYQTRHPRALCNSRAFN